MTTGIVLTRDTGTGRGTITARGASLSGTGCLGSSIVCPLIIAIIIQGMIAFVMTTSVGTGGDGSATNTGTDTTTTGNAGVMTDADTLMVDTYMMVGTARAVDTDMMVDTARAVDTVMMVDAARAVDTVKTVDAARAVAKARMVDAVRMVGEGNGISTNT